MSIKRATWLLRKLKCVFDIVNLNHIKVILVQQFLKVSHLSILPKRCYESLKLNNWMCEQCVFSQIRSQLKSNIEKVGDGMRKN